MFVPAVRELADGTLEINDVTRFVKPYLLTPDAPNQTINLAAAVAATGQAPVTVNQDGPVEMLSMLCQSTRFDAVGDHECTVILRDIGTSKDFMNRACHLNTIMGTSAFPGMFREHLYADQNRSYQLFFQNIFANANALQPVFNSIRYYTSSAEGNVLNALDRQVQKLSRRAISSSPFWMTTSEAIDDLAIGGTATYQFPSEADAYFQCFAIACVWYDNSGPFFNVGTFNWTLQDETGRNMMTGDMSEQLGIGDAMQPFELAHPFMIRPKQQYTLTVTSTHTQLMDIYFTLIGRKLYV